MAASAVLAGSYEAHQDILNAERTLLQALQMSDRLRDTGPDSMPLTVETYTKFWNTAKEKTSTYPDALSFSTMKASSKNSAIAEVECMLTRIPLKAGCSPSHWKNCMDVMLLKRSVVSHLGSLCTVVLFSADCNYAFKHIGHQMMKRAEAAKALAKEQYGSRKSHKATDLATNKTLTYDILRQLKQPGVVCLNDAKSCYDLIGQTQASLAMRRMGVPKSAVDCIFMTLQEANHRVHTGYRDFTASYGGNKENTPMHGICQGNGAGPAIWAILSSPLLDIQREKGFGFYFFTPLSKQEVHFVG
jgi:hypothetical protein